MCCVALVCCWCTTATFQNDKRPVVEFSIENALILRKRENARAVALVKGKNHQGPAHPRTQTGAEGQKGGGPHPGSKGGTDTGTREEAGTGAGPEGGGEGFVSERGGEETGRGLSRAARREHHKQERLRRIQEQKEKRRAKNEGARGEAHAHGERLDPFAGKEGVQEGDRGKGKKEGREGGNEGGKGEGSKERKGSGQGQKRKAGETLGDKKAGKSGGTPGDSKKSPVHTDPFSDSYSDRSISARKKKKRGREEETDQLDGLVAAYKERYFGSGLGARSSLDKWMV